MPSKKPKPARKPAATIPAWTCPKCGATHPITVDACCKPAATFPLPAPCPPRQPIRVRPLGPFTVPFQPGIMPFIPADPNDIPRVSWSWKFPPDITCEVRP